MGRQGSAYRPVAAVLALLLASACGPDRQLRASSSVNPVIPFVGREPVEWPLWPMAEGWLVGGSGYRAGRGGPDRVTPGLGLPALLFPSRRTGSWLAFPGVIEVNPIDPTFPVWSGDATDSGNGPPEPSGSDGGAQARPSASPSRAPSPEPLPTPPVPVVAWTKMGDTLLPRPVVEAWPDAPVHLSPWGPVTLGHWSPPENRPVLAMGFPVAGGTPVAEFRGKVFLRAIGGATDVVHFDFLTRTLHPLVGFPISLVPRSVSERNGLYLFTLSNGSIALVDQVSESFDPLPEVTGNAEYRPTHRVESLFYTVVADGRRQVHVFDRRTRMIDRLSRLNAGRDVFDSAPSRYGRLLAVTLQRDGHTDLALYDTVTGLLDPLPAINTPGNERFPDLDESGRWLAYVTDAPGRQEARVFDRLTGGIDVLPEVNVQAPILDIDHTGDSYLIYFAYERAGRRRVAAYVRPSGIIDPLPEVNAPEADVDL
jgi:hypothetical protein